MSKSAMSVLTDALLARHSILMTLIGMRFQNKTQMLKASIDSDAAKLAFLKRRGLLPDYEEFLNELKIETKILEEKNVQEK
ncbi:hypothetical protein [Leptospira santarosai]|uniref:hypothetical protein n=1 Tax=Leptospira santarosai TaxID=28183 RepID=UPI000774A33B|nr:hypothetical protein [Leptospira santarosai]MDI7196314.1 hypothetical protein [Leptospira santarosai]MDI7202114.1 hypothetical protein [Leptospira santarosai]